MTLKEFATPQLLTNLLVKERVKARHDYKVTVAFPNRRSKRLQMLAYLMPARNTWVRPSKRSQFVRLDGKKDIRKIEIKALQLTISRDRKAAVKPLYLERLDGYIEKIREEFADAEGISFQSPLLKPLYKDVKRDETTGRVMVTYRPLAVYNDLHDKLILAVTSRYIAIQLNRLLHNNILSYRTARTFNGERHHVTDFNDGIKLIRQYRNIHQGDKIYVSDCDIKKFYDSLNHNVVRECFERILGKSNLTDEGKSQVMAVLNAYLKSYNFHDNVLMESKKSKFWKDIRRRRLMNGRNTDNEDYRFGWLSDDDLLKCYGSKARLDKERNAIGVPQGGALSLMIADVVLNDIDQQMVNPSPFPGEDKDKLFIRFCDDMVMMHTSKDECSRLMEVYCKNLTKHKLVYHPFTQVETVKDTERTGSITAGYWNVKSHSTFLWDQGDGAAAKWIGFLGYEINREGDIRLRKRNVTEKLGVKIWKMYGALCHKLQKEDLTPEELDDYLDGALQTLTGSTKFYTGLQQEDGIITNRHVAFQMSCLNQKRRYALRKASCKALGRTGNKTLRNIIRKKLKEPEFRLT